MGLSHYEDWLSEQAGTVTEVGGAQVRAAKVVLEIGGQVHGTWATSSPALVDTVRTTIQRIGEELPTGSHSVELIAVDDAGSCLARLPVTIKGRNSAASSQSDGMLSLQRAVTILVGNVDAMMGSARVQLEALSKQSESLLTQNVQLLDALQNVLAAKTESAVAIEEAQARSARWAAVTEKLMPMLELGIGCLAAEVEIRYSNRPKLPAPPVAAPPVAASSQSSTAGGLGLAYSTPAAAPPVAAPPVAAPPVAAPPVAAPPVATPPVEAPPVATPPVAPPEQKEWAGLDLSDPLERQRPAPMACVSSSELDPAKLAPSWHPDDWPPRNTDGPAGFLSLVFGEGKNLKYIRESLVDASCDGDETPWDAVESWVRFAVENGHMSPLDFGDAVAAIRSALGTPPPTPADQKGEVCDLAAFDAQRSLGGSRRTKPAAKPTAKPAAKPAAKPTDPVTRARLIIDGDQRRGKDRRGRG